MVMIPGYNDLDYFRVICVEHSPAEENPSEYGRQEPDAVVIVKFSHDWSPDEE